MTFPPNFSTISLARCNNPQSKWNTSRSNALTGL